MSRDQIVTKLQSHGAFSLIRSMEDVEAGRIRRIRIDPIPGDPGFFREVIEYLRSLGAEIEIPFTASTSARLPRAG